MIEWTPSLSVGNAEIDRYQQDLYSAAQRVVAGAGRGDRELEALILRLVEAARTLFAAEERLLDEARAPTLVRHAHEHQRFLRDLSGIAENLARGERDAVNRVDLARFVPSWLASHLSRSDRDLARVARRRSAAG